MKNMQNDKSPCNDELTKEFYETFQNELKEIFADPGSGTKEKGHLSTSQRQVIEKVDRKKDKVKRYIENWTPYLC